MGLAIPQVITSDSASGAQIIDGSLTFQRAHENYLTRAVSSEGDRQKWTFSCWIKRDDLPAASRQIWGQVATNHSSDPANGRWQLYYDANENLNTHTYNQSELITSAKFRDTGWYHVVQALDTTLGSSEASSRLRLYINGVEQTGTRTNPTENARLAGNSVGNIVIGTADNAKSVYWIDAKMTQVYFIDGQQLGPEFFGFTDPLTGIWKPKKYVNTTASHGDAAGVVGFGTNGFYLPLDGSASIGQDQSGQGNDFTPNGFGNSVELDSPLVTGARPILNTTPGGTRAGVGVFGSKQNVGYAVTYYDDGGGNKYYIDGVKQATLTGLIRGATYTFNTVALGSTHPFRLSATSAHGTEYTNGVAAITGAATTITIPYDAPNELYYYCTAHSGMGADITGITTNEKLADQYASHCVLAMPLVGVSTDVSASIACTMTNKTVTSNGDVIASQAESNFYNGSFEFDGSGDYLVVTNTSDLVFEEGTFTIECWMYAQTYNSITYPTVISKYDNGDASWILRLKSDGDIIWYAGQVGGGTNNESTTQPIQLNKWHHLAVVREGTGSNQTKVYVDGILQLTCTDSSDYDDTNNIYIGRQDSSNANEFDGYIQDVRIYKGATKYTSDFVVPSTSPDILPETPSGVSGGSKLTKITDGAVSFNGSDQYLSLANTTDTNFGSGDFTVECHAYFTSVSAETLLGQWENGSSRRSWLLQVNSGTLSSYLSADGTTSGMKRIDSASGVILNNRWYHLAFARSGDTMRMFIDGEQVGSVDVTGFTNYANTDDGFQVGSQTAAGSNLMSGFISNARIIKGTGIYTSNFTPPSAPLANVTNTKLLCCQSSISVTTAAVTPGTITDNQLRNTATNFNPFNTDINTVRGQETGYPTLNPLSVSGSGGNRTSSTLSNGNLTSTNPGSNAWNCRLATVGVDSGKWYYEYTINGSISNFLGGWADSPNLNWADAVGNTSRSYGYYSTGNVRNSNSNTSFGDTYTVGDVIGCAIDLDNYKIYWSKNGVWQNSANPVKGTQSIYTVSSGYQYFPAVSTYDSNSSVTVNFGQNPFSFPPPDGYLALNAANTRPVNVISRPDQYVGIVTYTGDGNSPRKISGYNFAPDLIWYKQRNSARDHQLYDTVRGSGSNKNLSSNTTYSETANDDELYGYTSAFNDNGFTVTTGSSNFNYANASSSTYVAWAWKAGGSKNTFNVDDVGYASAAAAGLTAGDITPTGASVGTKQGFSIIRWTAPTWNGSPQQVPHGLTQSPSFIIAKVLNDTASWVCYHKDLDASNPQNKYLTLNSNSAVSTLANGWGTSAPNSTTFGDRQLGWSDGKNVISYIWHDVPGLQKFGTYVGNENTGGDGPFVELGFRPAIIWIKNTNQGTSAADWVIYDSERNKFNPSGKQLYPNRNIAEADDSSHQFDILSNGFKVRSTSTSDLTNATDTYIYCAWAEAPSVDLFGGGANAR